jgi:hypothetical protein
MGCLESKAIEKLNLIKKEAEKKNRKADIQIISF